MRGLKQLNRSKLKIKFTSHPTWVRGLKQHVPCPCGTPRQVAPYVGAWIETYEPFSKKYEIYVAPYVGAWIETPLIRDAAGGMLSHPTWVRGLKLLCRLCFSLTLMSHPTWVRGLKHSQGRQTRELEQSHPTWVRGLKHRRSGRR